jgi:hypothetical protein
MTFRFNLKGNGRSAIVIPKHATLRCVARITIKRLSILVALFAVSVSATAQNTSIVGTWALTAADKILPDGTRVPDYGPNPHGLVIFTANGYYSLQIYRADRLKFASGDKFKGTLKHTITFQRDRSSVPNLDDKTAVDPYELKGDELSWKVAPRQDGSVPITVLQRVQ